MPECHSRQGLWEQATSGCVLTSFVTIVLLSSSPHSIINPYPQFFTKSQLIITKNYLTSIYNNRCGKANYFLSFVLRMKNGTGCWHHLWNCTDPGCAETLVQWQANGHTATLPLPPLIDIRDTEHPS